MGPRIDERILTKVRTRRIKKKEMVLQQLVAVCWSCSVDSWFLGFSKFVLKQMKKDSIVVWSVKGNDTQMEVPLLSLKSQQNSIKIFCCILLILSL